MATKSEPTFDIKDSERQSVIEELMNLKNQPGWQRLEKYYDNKIKFLELQLAEGEIESIPELKLLRARRNMAIQFRNLPEILIEFARKEEGIAPELDPYAKPFDNQE